MLFDERCRVGREKHFQRWPCDGLQQMPAAYLPVRQTHRPMRVEEMCFIALLFDCENDGASDHERASYQLLPTDSLSQQDGSKNDRKHHT